MTVSGVPVTTTAWWLPAALGGALVALGGLLALLHGSRWPVMGRRYDRDRTATGGPDGRSESAWDLLDRGVDPTDERPSSRSADGPADGPDDPMLGNGARS